MTFKDIFSYNKILKSLCKDRHGCIHLYLVLGRMKQEDCCEFEAELGHKACIDPARAIYKIGVGLV